jgi:hypothetical protein
MATAQALAAAFLVEADGQQQLDTAFWIERLKTTYPDVIRAEDRDFERYNKLLLMYQQKENVELTCMMIMAGLYAFFPINAESIQDDFNFLLAMRLSQSKPQEVFYKHGALLLKKKFYQTLRYMEQVGVNFAVMHMKYSRDVDLSDCEGYDGTLESVIQLYTEFTKG